LYKFEHAITIEPVDVGDPSVSPVEFIGEDKGLDSLLQNEYDRYDLDPNEEEWIKGQGGTIIKSDIEITDSAGNNGFVVKRA
jgi:hypothetical protein